MAKTAEAAVANSTVVAKKKKRFKPGYDIPRYLFILPAFTVLAIFHYGPIYGILIAFQDFSPYRGVWGSEWIGLFHFRFFLQDPVYWRVMRNTILINIQSLVMSTPVPILFAIFLNELKNPLFKRVVQTISYLPHFISWVVVAGIVITLLDPTKGLFNTVLVNLFGIEPIFFLGKASYFRTILIVVGIWKGFGMSSVYYLSALSGIDPQLYEAAKIDGAGRIKQMIHITLPGIASIFVLLTILNIGSLLSIGFENVFLLYNPLVYETGDVISTYTYRLGIEETQYSLTTAIGITQSVVNFILVFSANRISKKVVGYSMW